MDLLSLDNIKTAILVISLLFTFWTYKASKWVILRNAAALVTLQSKKIEKSIEVINDHYVYKGKTNNNIDWDKIADMDNIFEEDYWEQYRHLFIFYLGENDFNQLENFFSNARKLKIYQSKVREFIFSRADYQVKVYYEVGYRKIFEEVAGKGTCGWEHHKKYVEYYREGENNDGFLKIETFRPAIFTNLFLASLQAITPIGGTTGFDKLELIGNRTSWFTLWLTFKFLK